MSKNVAVFVDVANIFYAAKAAGIDIDYVTLLKSATANRDLVRAYAYTGLDPENENQRQFHAFLARAGYKVVSKDIRKYGDGRVKANLDIELVVDMMRLAEKLDIAVVISGDGDFAPAIVAVQQLGVRVEVISFRGNTSSDLVDVADVFVDITNVARVEKGARSGRRVAADGDLSMTAVPEKESGVTPRRRRRGGEPEERVERAERGSRRRPAPVDESEVGEPLSGTAGLVALPGEKLSRGPAASVNAGPAEAEGSADEQVVADVDGEAASRRRRRRRGGRGRGRGGRPTEEREDQEGTEEEAPTEAAYADEVPTLPQHSGFGSVWDSQLGVPRSSAKPAVDESDEDEVDGLEDEPEVPEYLLAETRQGQGRRRGGRSRAGRSGYRSALDRERYGASGSGSAYGRASGSRGRDRSGERPRASAHAMQPIEQTPGGDPWSEVPPEVQELLRAEMARRAGATKATAPAETVEAPGSQETAEESKAKPAAKRPARKRTTKAPAPAETVEAPGSQETAEESKAKPAAKRPARKRTTKAPAPAETVEDA